MPRTGPPKHQNSFAWIPNVMDKHNSGQKKLDRLNLLCGVCLKCCEVIEWKRKYGKYKQLKQPAKCVACSQKEVHQAYHQLCLPCATERGVCAKCMEKPPAPPPPEELEARQLAEQAEIEAQLRSLNERQRRSANRQLAIGVVPSALTARVEKTRADDAKRQEPRAPGYMMSNGKAPAASARTPSAAPAAADASAGVDACVLLERAVALGLLSEAQADRLTDSIATREVSEAEVVAEWVGRVGL